MHWFQSELQTKVDYKAGDVIISVPAKSGTTWTMNIVHQMMSGGDPFFKDIYAEVPWVEFKEGPDQTDEELLNRWENMKYPRAFKTHSYPDTQAGGFLKFRKDLKYIVVFRNPEEALVSLKPFLESHSQKLFDLWDASDMREELCNFSNFTDFFENIVMKGFPGMHNVPTGGLIRMFYIFFINAWWPLRNEPNVLLLHFNDMKEDHFGILKKISNFLNIKLSGDEWHSVTKYTSFKWMKANEEKFELTTLLPFPLIQKGGMVRKGEKGKAMEDGMTHDISNKIQSVIDEFVEDENAKYWMYHGGTFDYHSQHKLKILISKMYTSIYVKFIKILNTHITIPKSS